MLVSLALALTMVAHPQRLVIVSWDGAAEWVVDQLLAKGELPNVAKLRAAAEYSIPPFPSKTAVSHFAIFSATWPNKSGVSGNSSPLLPRSQHTIEETQSGFNANQHLTEPFWVTAARQGKRVLALSAAGTAPPPPDIARLKAAGVPLDRYIQFSGFESGFASAQVIDYAKQPTFKIGDTRFDLTLSARGLRISSEGKAFEVISRAAAPDTQSWVGPFTVRSGQLCGREWFRLYSLDRKSGHSVLYARAVADLKGTQGPLENQRYLDAYGAFHDDPFGVYENGQLGKPIYEGGDGTAEKRTIEAVRLDMDFLKRSFRYGLAKYQPDLVFHYSPQTDNAGHCWVGLLDPKSPGYRKELAAKIWPYYAQVYRLQDEWLGDMMKAAGPSTLFALVSDHGMAGVTKTFGVNTVLKDAGLLTTLPDGRIDFRHSQVVAPPWSDFAVAVNGTDRKGGCVPPTDAQALLDRARVALLAARDPKTGVQIVRQVWTAQEAEVVGGGGEAGGDLYLDLADGYYPSNRANAPLVAEDEGNRARGEHGYYPMRPSIHAIFRFGGAGTKAAKLPAVRVIDIVPTLCDAMGWKAPADAQGVSKLQARR